MSTLNIMWADVAAELGLDNSTGGEQPLITGWLNDAVLDVLRRTQCYVTSATAAATPSQNYITLGNSVLAIRAMYVTDASTSDSSNFEELALNDMIDLQLNSVADSPSRYFTLEGSNRLLLYPTPSGADTITMLHVPVPTPMSLSSHDPSNATYGGIPSEYHRALELYAFWRGGSYKNDKSSAQGERYRLLYEGQDGRGGFLAQMNRELRSKAGVRPGKFQVLPRRRRRFGPHNNSTDWSPWSG